MGLLDSLLGNQQQEEESRDYVNRYEQGDPAEGYSDREVLDRYGQVTSQMSRQEYEDAAAEAFSRLSPEQRRQFLSLVRERANQRQLDMPQLNREYADREAEDPRELARITSGVEDRQPGLLEQLLGGLGGGLLGGQQRPVPVPQSRERYAEDQPQSLFDNPIAKAALAGIAAIAIKKAMSGDFANRQGGLQGNRVRDDMI